VPAKKISFVAQPYLMSTSDIFDYVKPDDIAYDQKSWRGLLIEYNRSSDNANNFLPAISLYTNPIYKKLELVIPKNKLFILSAGWGMLSSTFLTPSYDITYSSLADKYKFRNKKKDSYKDFSFTADDVNEDVVFFGGKDYVSSFVTLTKNHKGQKIIFYNSKNYPIDLSDDLSYKYTKYETKTKTNWHYECVNSYLKGAKLWQNHLNSF
jgi:hypothetical protein